MQVIPSIDVAAGRSRVVFWPGVSAGTGTPTDRPEVIAEHFVHLGAPLVHIVDFDGARAGRPVNTDVLGAIASRLATPLQLAGGVDDADGIRLAFAAGATRVVAGLALADDPAALRECLAVAGDWLAIGLDARADRLAAFPWRRGHAPAIPDLLDELAGAGVRRVVVNHAGPSEPPDAITGIAARASAAGLELLAAGGARDLDAVRRLRDAGVAGIILGEALLSGAIDYVAAREAVA
ncbi:MAG TPA: HisA/HisF-related TIM barrel protein [Candidatus Limnocylindrales bacterium]|nr:HisA/HisF-related TIM barrel protein [Candidatus Limnocylindrales bacterium]